MTEFVPPENPLSTDQESAAAYPAPETETVTRWKVACAGDEARGLGHPKVWLAISPVTGFVDCGYCDKRFVIDRENASDDH
ncbi:zinc-finger domain-containing protein [Paracoccus sp. SCSIO 75233]|uniref:zinc-finger domain-containing protein n=1 Tax=Paracoccus sp. SCSIO 75233 TaxID=3017782 RepID=UPI0022F0E5EA|nr:zinc-finger domain-containing protein [Paracoccus sp. SCSIO 75233]WBU51983.1 zinc-finger domain-containing protein [Paracoccus sp. SCSIO 75233]